jgi:hypothetical protein
MSEQIYDEQIAPKLLELARICHDNGMPFLATVEYAPGDYGTTADLPADHSLPMDWAYVAARAGGHADLLIGHLVSQAEKRGHGSVYLKQLGVALKPTKELAA